MKVYNDYELFQPGSWLQRPVQTVMELFPLFENCTSITMLDIGCGVGRNSIPFAKHFSSVDCTVDCIDLLEIAIEKLNQNSIKFGVDKFIKGYTMPIEDFIIPANHYDCILAVSALEHIQSEKAFVMKLQEIKNGLKQNGIFCLVANTEILERDKETGAALEAQFEVNLTSAKMRRLLSEIFEGWNVRKESLVPQTYVIQRESREVVLMTRVITLVLQKGS
jgi:2-polyprenyl-3-methyl-5-hydroxy-6-metoxy-1,4-benzoquinol methylase